MKFRLPFLLTFGLLFLLKISSAQDTQFCGTPAEKSAWLRYYQTHLNEFDASRNDDSTWLYVPMTTHILGTDIGTGYLTPEKIMIALCELNQDYAPSKIRFYLPRSLNYINKTDWYTHKQFGPGGEMMQQNNFPLCLNSYIVNDPAGNCGYYWGQFDGLALAKSCIGSNENTWAHELGHNLSLPHPFFGWEGHNNYNYATAAPTDWDGYAVEKIDGSNCQFAGDGFCDTPPDYLNYRWACNSSGVSTVVEHDPDSVAFQSDATLYMSYSLDACSNRFSHEQTKAMRANLQFQRSDLLSVTTPVADLDENTFAEPLEPAFEEVVQYDSFNLKWSAVPGADMYQVLVSFWLYPQIHFVNEFVNAPATNLWVKRNLSLTKDYRWTVTPYSFWDFCAPDSVVVGKFKVANFVATNELERLATATLAPNPTSSTAETRLEIESIEAFDGSLDVVDFSGKTLVHRSAKILEGSNSLDVPTENLPSGIFQLVLRSEKGTITKRLILID